MKLSSKHLKMHLYTITRGIKDRVDATINDLQAMNFTQINNDETGKKVESYTQLQVRPIQLWEFVFPREHLNHMLATMNYRDNADGYKLDKFVMPIRAMLKLKKIPKLDYSKIPRQLIRKEHVAFHHIGTKEDLNNEQGTELLWY